MLKSLSVVEGRGFWLAFMSPTTPGNSVNQLELLSILLSFDNTYI